jgi:predicted lipoprotein with Yx(FWY)xxD motif
LAAPAGSSGATTTKGKTVMVSTAKVAGVGTVLTTASGLNLYRFTKDSPGMSICTGACARIWPPLLAAKGAHVSGPHGVKGLSLLSVGSGHWWVAFHKVPLYRFEGDKRTKGRGRRTDRTSPVSGSPS